MQENAKRRSRKAWNGKMKKGSLAGLGTMNCHMFEKIWLYYIGSEVALSLKIFKKFVKDFSKASKLPVSPDFARDILKELDIEHITYENFRILFVSICKKWEIPISHELDRSIHPSPFFSKREVPVSLSVYDLNDLSTINNYTIRLGFGAFHCGVTVYGKEYSYAYPKGIFNIEPMKAEWIGKFRAAFHMGNIGITESEVRWIIAELRPEFNGQDYDILSHNCNHFCDALLVKLVHHHIPGSFNKLARFVQNFKGMLGDNFLVPDLNKDQQVNERINIFVSKLDEEEPVQSEDITPDLLNKLLEINRDLRTSTKTFEEIVSESCHDHDNDREGLLLPPPLPIPLLLTDMDENQGDQFGDLEDVFNQECSLKVSVPFSTSVDMQFKESSSMKHVKSTGSIPTTPKTTTFEPRRQSKTDFPVKQSATDTPKRYPLTAKLDPNLSRTRDLKAAVSVSEKKPKRAPREERKPGPPASASAITLTSPRGSKKALGGLEEKAVRKSKERKRLKPSKSSEYGTRRKLKEEGKGVEGMVKESHIL